MSRHGERLTYPDYGRDEILRDFAKHAMTVVRDDGLHRHLKFRAPDTGVYWFDVVTWPGVLVINGDCGTYVFARVEDMFTFFRGGNGRSTINPDYWSGKLLATDCHGSLGHKRYSEHKGRAALASAMRTLRERGASNEVVRDLRETAVLDADATELIRSVSDWSHEETVAAVASLHWSDRERERTGRGWRVDAFYEHNFDDWTLHFLWCLHAIVWGIAQYDAARQPAVAGATP